MSRYYFDIVTVDREIRDDIGLDLSRVDQVWPEIAQLVHDHLLRSVSRDLRPFDVTVRDEAGRIVARSTSTPPAGG